MAPAPVFLEHPSSLEHDTGGHPESARRIVAVQQALDDRGWLGYSRVSSEAVSRETLTAVHPESYVSTIEGFAARGGGHLDADTIASPGSFQAALHACGGAVQLVDLLVDGAVEAGFSAHRPPGHHAEAGRAMGFCLFNNVAVAARHAIAARGLERVMIVDWDVHHGNGTNDIFRSSSSVLFVSIHQSPLYPGTGPASDVGVGAGEGFTVNLPVPPGSGDADYLSLFEHVVVPLAAAFSPELLLISAGYDASAEDPLADCCVTDEGFGAMAGALARLGVPVGGVLEGGYALGALAGGVVATLEALRDRGAAAGPAAGAAVVPAAVAVPAVGASPLALAARERLAAWWPTLA